MTKENFYERQTDLTAAKIRFYREYIGGYLIKVLMTFGTCFVADLFCGRGKNADKDGSPLVLINTAQKMLESPALRKKQPGAVVEILFNDADAENISSLNEELSKVNIPPGIKLRTPTNRTFSAALDGLSGKLADRTPKFFFLDPFTYSDVQIPEIKKIIDSPYSEVLLFLPTYHAYRFSGVNTEPKTKKFLQNFTTRGTAVYSGIQDFNDSIRQKLRQSLGLDFIRPILLDGGKSKNSLFFLTKHLKGMLLMNKLVWGKSSDGISVKVEGEVSLPLFAKAELAATTRSYAEFAQTFEAELKTRRQMKNTEIIRFAALQGFLPEHARSILANLGGKIAVSHIGGGTRGFYVSESNCDSELSVISYNG